MYNEFDGEGIDLDDSSCMECGAMQFRESSVPGICAACLSGDFDDEEEFLLADTASEWEPYMVDSSSYEGSILSGS